MSSQPTTLRPGSGSGPAVAATAATGTGATTRRGWSGKRDPLGAKPTWSKAIKKDWRLYTFVLLPLLFFVIFRYLPMIGNVIAFRRFRPGGSILGDKWVGTRYFEMFVSDPAFWKVFWNTLILGGLSLIIIFPLPIILALTGGGLLILLVGGAVYAVSQGMFG